MTEQEAREYVSKLKDFYKTAFAFLTLNLTAILLWLLIGEDYFWPGWVLLFSCAYLIKQAMELSLIPSFNYFTDKLFEFLPGFSPEWEDEQISKLTELEEQTSPIKKTKVKKS